MIQIQKKNNKNQLRASFRDPSGFLFRQESNLFQQINHSYALDYQQLMESGLYDKLTKLGCLFSTVNVMRLLRNQVQLSRSFSRYKSPLFLIRMNGRFCFFKDAALATLRIKKIALKNSMSLKDASAYNIQIHHGRSVLIDIQVR